MYLYLLLNLAQHACAANPNAIFNHTNNLQHSEGIHNSVVNQNRNRESVGATRNNLVPSAKEQKTSHGTYCELRDANSSNIICEGYERDGIPSTSCNCGRGSEYKLCSTCLCTKHSSPNLPKITLEASKIKIISELGGTPHETSATTDERQRDAAKVGKLYVGDPGLQGTIKRADFLRFMLIAYNMLLNLYPLMSNKKKVYLDAGCASGKTLLMMSEAMFGDKHEQFDVFGAELGDFYGTSICFPGRVLMNTNLNVVAPWNVNIVYVFLSGEKHMEGLMNFLFQPGQNTDEVVLVFCDGYSGNEALQNRWINKYLPDNFTKTTGQTKGGSSHSCYIFSMEHYTEEFKETQRSIARKFVANSRRVSFHQSRTLAEASSSRVLARNSANKREYVYQEAKFALFKFCAERPFGQDAEKKFFKSLEFGLSTSTSLIGFCAYLEKKRIHPKSAAFRIKSRIIQYGMSKK